jgi:hypothetical protein
MWVTICCVFSPVVTLFGHRGQNRVRCSLIGKSSSSCSKQDADVNVDQAAGAGKSLCPFLVRRAGTLLTQPLDEFCGRQRTGRVSQQHEQKCDIIVGKLKRLSIRV